MPTAVGSASVGLSGAPSEYSNTTNIRTDTNTATIDASVASSRDYTTAPTPVTTNIYSTTVDTAAVTGSTIDIPAVSNTASTGTGVLGATETESAVTPQTAVNSAGSASAKASATTTDSTVVVAPVPTTTDSALIIEPVPTNSGFHSSLLTSYDGGSVSTTLPHGLNSTLLGTILGSDTVPVMTTLISASNPAAQTSAAGATDGVAATSQAVITMVPTHSSFPLITVSIVQFADKDGHTSTIGVDGQSTPVPIIKAHCFFCPPDSGTGFAFFGIGPGIWPPGPPPLPGFGPIPALTIAPNGDPTYTQPAKETTKPLTSAPTVTASSLDSTLTTTSTSSASSSTSSEASTCSSAFSYPGMDLSNTESEGTTGDPSDEVSIADLGAEPSTVKAKREVPIAGRVMYQPKSSKYHLSRRRGTKRPPWRGPDRCPLRVRVNMPGHLAVGSLMNKNYQKAGAVASSWYIIQANTNTCSAWELRTLKAQTAAGEIAPNNKAYDTVSADGKNQINTDHVYELHILKDFFSFDVETGMTDNGEAYCEQWNDFWGSKNEESPNYESVYQNFYVASSERDDPVWSRMKTIFKLLPGAANPDWADFAGTDAALNYHKGR